MLSVRNLSASFHTRAGIVRAVRNVSFDVAPGETLGIVGESGSGKSVTCYSMMGLIPMPPGRIESGSAMLDGTDLLRCPEKELRAIRGKRISMIFQDPMTSLNPYLTIGEQVAEPLVIHEGAGKKGSAGTRAGTACSGRHTGCGTAHGRISPPILRRHAPARDDCHGPHHQAGNTHRG